MLTLFTTPFGCYCFNRLLYGITFTSKHFQKRISTILRDMEGLVCLIDDILVFGKTQHEHDECLYPVMKRLQEAGLTLNLAKCEFRKSEVKFLSQVLPKDGVQSDF